MEPPAAVPRRTPSAEESLDQLELVIERVRYTIHWIATTPETLIDGQHHDILQTAIAELLKRVSDPALKTLFTDARARIAEHVARVRLEDAAPAAWSQQTLGDKLRDHGLTGAEWALKLEAFDRRFRALRDRMVQLEAHNKGHSARLLEIETSEFLVKIRRDSVGALGMGTTILGSAAEAMGEIPGAKALFGTLKEAAGALSSLMKD